MKIIIHGGFFSEYDQSAETKKNKQDALVRIVEKGYELLKSGRTARECVIETVKQLENDPLFNAGYGSQIQSDGKVRMSASLMDGNTQKFSGLINVQDVKHPIAVAAILSKEEDRVLESDGALNYAKKNNAELADPRTPERIAEYNAKTKSKGLGTVGCVALDSSGTLCAGTSTGGKGFEIPGRVSDSATVAGNYANEYCAVSCTGVGEDIVSNATATKIVTRRTDGMSLEDAFAKTFTELKKIDGFAGAIALDSDGTLYHQDSHPTMVWASCEEGITKVFS